MVEPAPTLPPLGSTTQIVSPQAGTPTLAFLAYLRALLGIVVARIENVEAGDIDYPEVGPWTEIDMSDLAGSLRMAVGVLVGLDDQPLDQRWSSLRAELDALASTVASVAASVQRVSTAQRALITNSLVTAQAEILAERLTRADADGALAFSLDAQIATITTGLSTVTAAVATESASRVTADSALATATTEVAAQLNDTTASGLVKFKAGTTFTGATVSYELVLRTAIGGTEYFTGWATDLIGGVGRIRFYADQFLVGNSSTAAAPFAVTGGVTHIKQAAILAATITTAMIGDLEVTNAKVANLTIGNEKYQAASISHTASTNQASDIDIGAGDTEEIVECISAARGGSTVVWASGAVKCNVGVNNYGCVRVGLYKNDVLQKYVDGQVDDNSRDVLNFSMIWKDTSPGTGNVYYQVKVERTATVYGISGTTGSGDVTATQTTIAATNNSKG